MSSVGTVEWRGMEGRRKREGREGGRERRERERKRERERGKEVLSLRALTKPFTHYPPMAENLIKYS